MTNEMMRIFFPLKIITYPQHEYGECGLDDPPEEITPAEAVAYEDAILAAIAKENRQFKNNRGLAEYIHEDALKEKVHSLYPSVEICDGELWGVMTAGLTGEIYVSLWNDENYSIKPEKEMKNSAPDLGYSGPVMGGM